MRAPTSWRFKAAIIFAAFFAAGLSALAFVPAPRANPWPMNPHEQCYGGVVYLQFPSGAVFAKLNRNGHLAGCP